VFQPKENAETAVKRLAVLAKQSRYAHTSSLRPIRWLGAQTANSE